MRPNSLSTARNMSIDDSMTPASISARAHTHTQTRKSFHLLRHHGLPVQWPWHGAGVNEAHAQRAASARNAAASARTFSPQARVGARSHAALIAACVRDASARASRMSNLLRLGSVASSHQHHRGPSWRTGTCTTCGGAWCSSPRRASAHHRRAHPAYVCTGRRRWEPWSSLVGLID